MSYVILRKSDQVVLKRIEDLTELNTDGIIPLDLDSSLEILEEVFVEYKEKYDETSHVLEKTEAKVGNKWETRQVLVPRNEDVRKDLVTAALNRRYIAEREKQVTDEDKLLYVAEMVSLLDKVIADNPIAEDQEQRVMLRELFANVKKLKKNKAKLLNAITINAPYDVGAGWEL